jgi:hypothetical protein
MLFRWLPYVNENGVCWTHVSSLAFGRTRPCGVYLVIRKRAWLTRRTKRGPQPAFFIGGHGVAWPASAFHLPFYANLCVLAQRRRRLLRRLTKRRVKRGVFKSVVDLQVAINRYPVGHNKHPKPFTWTKDPEKIIAAVKRGHQMLDSIH